jgi:adenine deaminase
MNRLQNVWLFNTARRSFEPRSLAFDEHIRSVASAKRVTERWVVPGFIDIHMHIESSMTTPTEFSRFTLPHGTTTIVSDCHEVANVFGVDGLLSFMNQPVLNDTYYAVPSSVPATSSALETSGGSIDEQEVALLCKEKKIIALGEVMNANDLFSFEDNRTKRIIRTFLSLRPECPVEGHCPRLTGEELDAFIASGVDSDHTEQTPESIAEKAAKGMFLEIQWKSLNERNVKALENLSGFFSFCTDDVMPDTLQREGHLDRILRKAIALGMKVEDAIFAMTWAPAVRMRLFDRGMLAPGKLADFIVLDDLDKLSIVQVWKRGKLVYDRDKDIAPAFVDDSSAFGLDSIKRNPVSPEDFRLRIPNGTHNIVHVCHQEGTTMTKKVVRECVIKNSFYEEHGINILASVERYGHQSPIVPVPMLCGLEKSGAICSSWAHDSHNLLVMATNPELASLAVNMVIEKGGGIAVVDEEGSFFLPLSFGGIVSLKPMEKLSEGVAYIRLWLRTHGFKATDEVMSFAVLALPVSPEVKVSDKGMIDVRSKRLISWRDAE